MSGNGSRPNGAGGAGRSGRARGGRESSDDGSRLARGLGWFSIGLGLAEVVAPSRVTGAIGVGDDRGTRILMRATGIREIINGVSLLIRPGPAGLWARVGGDAMDLALLGWGLAVDGPRPRTVAATAAVASVTAVDAFAAGRRSFGWGTGPIEMEKAITIAHPPDEVYGFWHDFRNLPHFMIHLESVERLGDGRSHWTAKGPAGTTIEWDAEMTEDRPNELIAWRSLPGTDVPNSGSVRFSRAPGGRGTEVRVRVRYDPPAGALGAAVAGLFGERPDQQVQDGLRRLKQVMETGEVIRSAGSPRGTDYRQMVNQRPAQPARARTE